MQVSCRLPQSYPDSPPVICVRSESLNSTEQHRLNSSLQQFVCQRTSDGVSSGVLNEVIQWLTENFPSYTTESFSSDNESNCSEKAATFVGKRDFSRMWIYSHHIYNREKRRTVIDTARELDLTGFSAPGKPGVICVEGCRSSADSFWQQIRSLQWQRITLVHREDCTTSSSDVNGLRRFENFEEKCFVNAQSSSGRGTHLDRGQLLQFLQQSGCKDVFRLLFGIDVKEASSV